MLLAAGLAGSLLFVLVFLVEGAIRPGYDPRRHPVSALALGRRGWVQATSFMVTGALMVAFALGVGQALPGADVSAVWVQLLLVAFALGLIASGLFTMDPPPDYPPEQERPARRAPSWRGRAHDAAGLVVFTALPAAALLLAYHLRDVPGLGWLAIVSVVAGLLCAGAFVAFVVADERASPIAGLLQRVSIVAGWSWIVVVAVALAQL